MNKKFIERRAEDRIAEWKYRTLMENLLQKVFLKDKNSTYLSCNAIYAQDFGLKPEEIEGKTDFDFYPRDLADKYRQDDQRIMKKGEPESFDERTLLNNKELWVRTTKVPVRDEKKNVTGILGIFWDITEQKKAQEKIEYQALLLSEVNDAVIGTDNHSRMTFYNKAAEALFGWTTEEALGKISMDLMKTEYVGTIREEAMHTLERTGRWRGEITRLRKDGTRVALEVANMALKDDEGKWIGIVGVIRDITERKRAEEQIKQRTEDLSLVNAINSAANCGESLEKICSILAKQTRQVFNGNGATVYVINEAEKQLSMIGSFLPPAFEKKIQNLIGMSIPKLKLPLETMSIYQRSMLEGKPQILDNATEIRTLLMEFATAAPLPGTLRTGIMKLLPQIQKLLNIHSVLIMPLMLKEQRIGILELSRNMDFTDSDIERLALIAQQLTATIANTKAHDEIARLGNQNQLILQSAGEGILGLGNDGKHTFVNPQAAHMLGYEMDELIGRESHSVWHHTRSDGSPCPESECPIFAAFRDGVVHRSFDDLFWRKDGTSIPVSYTSNPIFEKRRVAGAVVTFTDITERKQAEQRIRTIMQDLERSNKELEQFAYVASHDLQEPLRMVASYTQLLEKRYKDQLDEDARDFINYAVDGANRMQQLINDLLSYSRVGTRGKEMQPVDAHAALGQARTNLSLSIEEAHAVVTNDDLPMVLADESQLVQLFQNLIGNAIKFHKPEESPRVHVSAESRDGEWIFSVRDNGIGIDPQYFERIFVIFQRLNTRENYQGTGIGLAICKKIVERHGGKIWVESQAGQGSTFYFTLKKS